MSDYNLMVTDRDGKPIRFAVDSINSKGERNGVLSSGLVEGVVTFSDINIPEDTVLFIVTSDGYYDYEASGFYNTDEAEYTEVKLSKKPNYVVAVLLGAAAVVIAQRYLKFKL